MEENLGPTLLERDTCAMCKCSFHLTMRTYVTLIACEESLRIEYRCANCAKAQEQCSCIVRDLHRTCMSFVPLEDTLKVCLPCWRENQHTELHNYANAPLAAMAIMKE